MAGDNLLFKYMYSINQSKKDFLLDKNSEECQRFKKEYKPYVINAMLAGTIDTVLLADEMNCSYKIPAERQFIFLLHTVPARKRFVKPPSNKVDVDIELLCRYYKVSRGKAREYLKLHNAEQMDKIREIFSDS